MINKYYATNAKSNKVIKATSRVVFSLATCVFLIWGLLFHDWSTCWIVYPITGILFGAFARTYNTIKENN